MKKIINTSFKKDQNVNYDDITIGSNNSSKNKNKNKTSINLGSNK